MDINDLQLLPPASWEKFEDICLDIFREGWGDPYAQKNGRRGQPQHGTDISGEPRHAPGELHGVQCKGKDTLYNGTVTAAELREEVAKALGFVPRLDHWILATTAPKDAAIEMEARRITADHRTKGLFTVRVFGWEDLRTRIADSDAVMEKHHPDQAPRQRQILEGIASLQATSAAASVTFQASSAEIHGALAAILNRLDESHQPPAAPADPAEVVLMARIDDARDLVRDSQPETALKLLGRLEASSWTAASEFARFRILANKAAALFSLGRNEEGARVSLDALPHAPDDPRAIIYAAQARWLLDSPAEARQMLDGLLARQPGNEDALALSIVLATDDPSVSDPYWQAGDQAAVGWNVVLCAGRWYRHRGMPAEAKEAFRRVLLNQPDRLDIAAEVATATLEDVFQDKAAVFARRLDAERLAALSEAMDLLRKVWDAAKGTELCRTYLWSLLNLCTALRYTSGWAEAYERITDALVLVPDDVGILQQKALVEAATGRHEQVIRTLDLLGSDKPEPRMMRSDALAALNRHAEALSALDDFPDACEPRLRITAVGSRVRLLVLLGRPDEARAAADAVTSAFPDSALARMVVSDLHRDLDQNGDALRETRAAAAMLDQMGGDGLERMVVGESLHRLHDWDGAADLLRGAGDPTQDSDPLRLRVVALLNAGRRRELADLLDAMPPEVARLPAYSHAAAWLFRLAGDYARARVHLGGYLRDRPKDLSMRMLWLDVAERQGDESAIQAFLAGDLMRFVDGGSTRDLMALAQRLVRHGLQGRGLDLGYRVLRERWDEPKAHLGYSGMFLMTRDAPEALPTPTAIAPGVAFTVRDEGGRDQTYVIEPDGNPRVILNEVGPASRLALSAMGRQVGDSIRVIDNQLVPEQQVVMLASKHVGLFQRSIAEFNTLFPDDGGMVGLSIDPSEPERGLERMLPVLSGRRAAIAGMINGYKASSLPVAFAARPLGLDPVDGWDAIRQSGEQLDVCFGTEDERRSALSLLRGRPSLVLDPVTLWTAGLLGLLDRLSATFGPLGVAASTLDLLAEREHSALESLRSAGGFLVEHDGRMVMTEPSEAEKQEIADVAARVAGWARRHAVVLPAIPVRDVDAEMRRLGALADPSVMDTLLAASGHGRVLICEDRRLRELASTVPGLRSAWLEPALMVSLHSGAIQRTAYDDAMLDLTLLGHRHVGLDGLTLLRATSRWGERSAGLFEKVVDRLAFPQVDVRSLLTVACTFLRWFWIQARTRRTKERFTAMLLSACRRAHAESPARAGAVLQGYLRTPESRGRPDDARQIAHAIRFIERWCRANPRRDRSPETPDAA